MNILQRIKNKILSSREEKFDKQMRNFYKDELLDAPLEHEFVPVHIDREKKRMIYLCNACHHQYIIQPVDLNDEQSHINLLNNTTAPCKPKNQSDYENHDLGGEG